MGTGGGGGGGDWEMGTGRGGDMTDGWGGLLSHAKRKLKWLFFLYSEGTSISNVVSSYHTDNVCMYM